MTVIEKTSKDKNRFKTNYDLKKLNKSIDEIQDRNGQFEWNIYIHAPA